MSLSRTVSSTGGKAAALRELTRAGFCVPEFVVATSESEPIFDLVREIGFPLAVRSSASLEDGTCCSFAGQFESYLNLRSMEEAAAAITKCFASARAPRVASYCHARGLDASTLRMAVILQRMIQPQLAGVAFTVCPVTGAEDVVVEACEGLGERLLQGEAPGLPDDHALLQKHLPQIEATCRRIQRHFGAPQDIEFAVADGAVYILQSRPVTKIEFAHGTEEWTSANFREGGVSSGVCSPLMWSLYEFIWEQTLKQSLREIGLYQRDFVAGRMIFGRPYWNLGAVKAAVARIPGYVEREFDEDLCIEAAYEGNGQCTPVNLGSLLQGVPTLLALPGYFRRQEQNANRLLDDFAALEKRCEAPAATASADDFRELIERDYWRVESTYFRTIFAVSLAKLEFKKLFPGCDYAALMAGLPELRHMAPVRQIQSMAAKGQRDVAPLARAFRHHCRFGVDVRYPRWDEDLEFVAELVADLPPAGDRNGGTNYEQARADAIAGLAWWKRPIFYRKLDRLRRLVWLREELRDLSGRMYYLIRRRVLAIAGRRGLADDIFFQTFRQIYADDRSQIEARREVFESYRNFQPPSVIGRRFRYEADRPAGALSGVGASGGIATGVACIAGNPAEALRAEPGAILVCPFVEPGWTPVLSRVSGLVTETGGRLSHAAVLCREYGIPAVLGVPRATQRIRDGQRVSIDGSRGLVGIQDDTVSGANSRG